MDIIDHTQNSKKLLINEILKTNNNIIFFQIYDKRNLLANVINSFNNDHFYKLLALFNHSNYNGYFSQKHKLQLLKVLNLNTENIKKFLIEWLEKDFPNEEILNIEIYSLNILLEKMIVKGLKNNILNELEEIKFNLFISTESLKNKFYNFKTKIITRDGKEKDVYKTLKSIYDGNHNLQIKDLVYIKIYYQDELELLKNF